jgi:hypothetical protein
LPIIRPYRSVSTSDRILASFWVHFFALRGSLLSREQQQQ